MPSRGLAPDTLPGIQVFQGGVDYALRLLIEVAGVRGSHAAVGGSRLSRLGLVRRLGVWPFLS